MFRVNFIWNIFYTCGTICLILTSNKSSLTVEQNFTLTKQTICAVVQAEQKLHGRNNLFYFSIEQIVFSHGTNFSHGRNKNNMQVEQKVAREGCDGTIPQNKLS